MPLLAVDCFRTGCSIQYPPQLLLLIGCKIYLFLHCTDLKLYVPMEFPIYIISIHALLFCRSSISSVVVINCSTVAWVSNFWLFPPRHAILFFLRNRKSSIHSHTLVPNWLYQPSMFHFYVSCDNELWVSNYWKLWCTTGKWNISQEHDDRFEVLAKKLNSQFSQLPILETDL